MGLFSPVWATNDPNKLNEALNAVKTADRKRLPEMARRARLPEVRAAVFGRITDIELLKKYYDTEEGARAQLVNVAVTLPWVKCKNLMNMMKDEDTSVKMILKLNTAGFGYSIKSAIGVTMLKNISSPDKLMEIVSKSQFNYIRRDAFDKLGVLSEEALFRLAGDKTIPDDIKARAVTKINDQKLLTELARKGSFSVGARKEACMKIKDEAFLLELAKDVSLPDDLRAPVITRITDKDFLEKTVFGEGSAKIRIAAVRGIKDKELLAKIRDTVPECRNAACDKLGHAWSFSHYTSHGNGGSDAVYVCDICGAEKKEPYEWSSADSV